MENKFRQLKSISHIVDTMIKGLKKEWVQINMGAFGEVVNGVCFGCAATNTLCELMQEPFTENSIVESQRRGKIGVNESELDNFEAAIDALRCGDTDNFLSSLWDIKHLFNFSLTCLEDIEYDKRLPELTTDNYKENLHYYEAYRDFLIAKGL